MHVNNLEGGQEDYAPIPFLMTMMTGEMSHSGEFKIGGRMESLVEMVYTN